MKLKSIGAYDAYVQNEKGEGVYDMSKDTRGDVYMKYGEDSAKVPANELQEYRKQQQMYYRSLDAGKALGGRFGELKYGQTLPQALDPDQQISLRTQADILYGNFNKDTKNLLSTRMLGRMFMQFKTYGAAKLIQYIKTPGAVNVFSMHIIEEINPKTGKLEKKVKVPTSDEEREKTGNYAKEVFESEVSEEQGRNNTASYVVTPMGDPLEGKFYTMISVLSMFKKSPKEGAEHGREIKANPAQMYNMGSAMFETIFMSIFATFIGRMYGEETITNLTDQEGGTRGSYNMLTGITSDGPIGYTMESMFSNGTLPMVSILKRYADNTIALFSGNSNVLYTLVNTFGATQELSSYFKD